MGIFKKDPAVIVSHVLRDDHRRVQQLPKLSAKEQKVVDGSIESGRNGTNRHRN